MFAVTHITLKIFATAIVLNETYLSSGIRSLPEVILGIFYISTWFITAVMQGFFVSGPWGIQNQVNSLLFLNKNAGERNNNFIECLKFHKFHT